MASHYDPFLGQPTASILLLGVFHFQDRGLDWHKPQHGFAVFAEQRQREILAVVEQLTRYQPTKVAIERTADQQATTDQEYAAYRRNDFTLPADEIYQLGFRLAKQMGHAQLYCVNAWDRHYEPQVDLEAYARQHGQELRLTEWSPRFEQAYQYTDQQVPRQTLQEIFLGGNAEANIIRSHGHYLVDWFKIGVGNEYPGADQVTGWYNRNLRIFANLQRITERPDERILLIIGCGHLPILRHCVQASPEYKLVEVHEYLTTPTGE